MVRAHFISGGDMNGIGWVVMQLQGGSRVRRAGWNGKGMYLELQVPDANSKASRRMAALDREPKHVRDRVNETGR
jgi:hypothetical protein